MRLPILSIVGIYIADFTGYFYLIAFPILNMFNLYSSLTYIKLICFYVFKTAQNRTILPLDAVANIPPSEQISF